MEQAALEAQFPATADAQPPPAANPSPPGGAHQPSHPSYAEMITAAILWGSSQGKEGGSSKRAIAKYIDRVYTNLPPSHSALLTHHLKRLKNSGQLVMIKNSYQLSCAAPPSPGSAPAAAPPPPEVAAATDFPPPVSPSPKKGPGRPPKPKPAMPISPGPVVDNGSGSELSKKRRGRPPKQQPQQGAVAAEVPFVQPISQVQPNLVNGGVASSGQKRRGRPPKQQPLPPVVPFAQPVADAAPVVQLGEEVAAPEVPKRRPGRPPKANVVGLSNVFGTESPAGGTPRSRGRPRKNPLAPISTPVGKKPRGRPRKIGGAVGGGFVGMGMVHGKRRGRPPKGGGPPTVRRRTGRPLGRPRKDGSTLRRHTSDQEGVANEELMRKFELIQSKVREAVSVIRPCVANENAALMALQELEELATVDLSATPISQQAAPPLTMPMPQSMGGPPAPAMPLNIAPASTLPPSPTVTAPFMGQPPAPFDISGPTMNVSGSFHAPPVTESQHPMSWIPSNAAQL